jgi:glycerol-3-phosphate O-acyltransferase 3/4
MTKKKRTFLRNAIDMVTMGSHALESDDFTRCFQPISPMELDTSGIFYIFSFAIRYFVLFPFRLVLLTLCFGVFLLMILKAVLLKSDVQSDDAFAFILRALAFIMNAQLTHFGEKRRLREPHIYVANHTSFVDFILLSSYKFSHACISENHGGLFGLLFKSFLFRNGSIAFKRSERLDRRLVVGKLREHVRSNAAPMLVFPEGTCVNNRFSVLFQKGAFELDAVICPVAIKFRRRLMDPYWNRRVHGFTMHMFYLLTRWRLEADIHWMEPMKRMEGETSTQFSHRVKLAISRRAGLKNTLWNGLLKSSPAIRDRELLREAFKITYNGVVSERLREKAKRDTEEGKFYLDDENIDKTSTNSHEYFGRIGYKKFHNEILKEYIRIKETPSQELKYLLSTHVKIGEGAEELSIDKFCSCSVKGRTKAGIKRWW